MGPGRLAARLIGCLLLAQSLLLLIGLAVDSAPPQLVLFLLATAFTLASP